MMDSTNFIDIILDWVEENEISKDELKLKVDKNAIKIKDTIGKCSEMFEKNFVNNF